jgi:hypothetical protein
MKIDNSRTISLLIKILKEHGYDLLKHNNIISYVIAENSSEAKTYIKEQLLSNSEMGTLLVSMLASFGMINNYIDYIFKNCDASTLQMALTMSDSNMWHINTDNLFNIIISRNDIDSQCFNYIISNKSIGIKDKITLVLHFYSKDTQMFETSLNNLINLINSDENSKIEFLQIAENDEYKESVRDYFKKNNYQKSNFSKYINNEIFN